MSSIALSRRRFKKGRTYPSPWWWCGSRLCHAGWIPAAKTVVSVGTKARRTGSAIRCLAGNFIFASQSPDRFDIDTHKARALVNSWPQIRVSRLVASLSVATGLPSMRGVCPASNVNPCKTGCQDRPPLPAAVASCCGKLQGCGQWHPLIRCIPA